MHRRHGRVSGGNERCVGEVTEVSLSRFLARDWAEQYIGRGERGGGQGGEHCGGHGASHGGHTAYGGSGTRSAALEAHEGHGGRGMKGMKDTENTENTSKGIQMTLILRIPK